MYKKEQFDRTIYYRNLRLEKWGMLDAILTVTLPLFFLGGLLLAMLDVAKISIVFIIFVVSLLFLFFIRISLGKLRRKKCVLGLNKDGIYALECGFLPWGEIKDIVIGYDIGRFHRKQRLIFLVPHDFDKTVAKMPFFKRLWFKFNGKMGSFTEQEAVPAVYEFYVQEPLEAILAEISDYVVNLDK